METFDFYIAGPMTGYFRHNAGAFNHAEEVLTKQGFSVVNPSKLDEILGPCEKREDYYRRDMRYLAASRRVAVLPGWEKSVGAKLELATAKVLAMPVVRLPDLIEMHPDDLPQIVLPTK
jgi:hypothetical protein